MAETILIYGSTETSPALRHEIPLAIVDPFLYLERDGRRAVLTHALEESRLAQAVPDAEILLEEALGRDELIAAGRSRTETDFEVCVRAAAALGIEQALVPPTFPLALADHLRAAGIELTPDEDLFRERRRRKSAAEIAGICRAAKVACAAMSEARRMFSETTIAEGKLSRDGEPLTAEQVRERIREVCSQAGAPTPADIMVVAAGPQAPIGHEPGSGVLPADTPIEVDLWPQDEQSGCWADMTRTFVCGEINDAIAEIHALVLSAHENACAAARPGITGAELYGVACDVFEAAGHPTQRTKAPGETLRDGFYFALGHGVGLEVHEAPDIGRADTQALLAGDVIAIEPGTVVPGVGGSRVEDLLIVTERDNESLTGEFPYGLTP